MLKIKHLIICALLCFWACENAVSQIPFRTSSGWMLKDTDNRLLLEEEYDFIQPLNGSFYELTAKSGLKSLVKIEYRRNATPVAKKITEEKYAAFSLFSEDRIAFAIGGKYHAIQGEHVGGLWGIMDGTGKVIVSEKYHQIFNGFDNQYLVQIEGNWGNWGVIDDNGNWLEKPVYETQSFDMRPHPTVGLVGKDVIMTNGFIKNIRTKKKVTNPSGSWFAEAMTANGVVIVRSLDEENSTVVVNFDGKTVIPSGIGSFWTSWYENSNFLTGENKKKNEVYLYSVTGKKIAQWNGTAENCIKNGYGMLKNNDEYIIYDSTGKITYKTPNLLEHFPNQQFFKETLSENQMIVIVSATGEKIEIPENTIPERVILGAGHIIVKTENRNYGIYDYVHKKMTVPCVYDNIRHHTETIYKVSFSDPYREYGYVNGATGEEYFDLKDEYIIDDWRREYEVLHKLTRKNVFDQKFSYIKQVEDNGSLFIGTIKNENGTQYHLLNASNKFMSDGYDNMSLTENAVIVTKNKKYGLLNVSGEEILSPQFTEIYTLNNNFNHYFIKTQSNKIGMVDMKGNLVLDTIHSKIYTSPALDMTVAEVNYWQKTYLKKDGTLVEQLKNSEQVKILDYNDWLVVYFDKKPPVLFNKKTEKTIQLPENSIVERVVSNSLSDLHVYFKQKGAYGIFNEKGETVLPVGDYTYLVDLSSEIQFLQGKKGALVVTVTDGKIGFEKKEGINYLSYRGLYGLKKGNSFLLVDKSFHPIVDETYKSLSKGDLFIIAQNQASKFGALDRTGKVVIPFEYNQWKRTDLWDYECFVKDGYHYLFDEEGVQRFNNFKIKEVIFDENLAESGKVVFKDDVGYQLVNITTEVVVLNKMKQFYIEEDWAYDLQQLLVVVEMETGFGLFDLMEERFVLQPVHTKIDFYNDYTTEQWFCVTQNKNGYNIFDLKQQTLLLEKEATKFILPQKWSDFYSLLINGETHILFSRYSEEKESVEQVLLNTGLPNGKYVFSYEYEDILVNTPVRAIVIKKGKKMGLFRTDGKWIHPITLDGFENDVINETAVVVRKGKLNYLVDLEGNYLLEDGFELIEQGYEDVFAFGYIGAKTYKLMVDESVQDRIKLRKEEVDE